MWQLTRAHKHMAARLPAAGTKLLPARRRLPSATEHARNAWSRAPHAFHSPRNESKPIGSGRDDNPEGRLHHLSSLTNLIHQRKLHVLLISHILLTCWKEATLIRSNACATEGNRKVRRKGSSATRIQARYPNICAQ